MCVYVVEYKHVCGSVRVCVFVYVLGYVCGCVYAYTHVFTRAWCQSCLGVPGKFLSPGGRHRGMVTGEGCPGQIAWLPGSGRAVLVIPGASLPVRLVGGLSGRGVL